MFYATLCQDGSAPPGTTVLGSYAILLSVGEPHRGATR